MMLDVKPEPERDPLDEARGRHRQAADQRIVGLEPRAQAVVREDERHHAHVRDKQRDHVNE